MCSCLGLVRAQYQAALTTGCAGCASFDAESPKNIVPNPTQMHGFVSVLPHLVSFVHRDLTVCTGGHDMGYGPQERIANLGKLDFGTLRARTSKQRADHLLEKLIINGL